MRLLLIIVLFGLTACNSAWDKDPFKDDSENVANGVKAGTKVKATPPLQSVVFINLEPFYELKEGKKLTIETGYRITHPEFKFIDFKVEDLEANFPGAEFDNVNNIITWTPDDDYVPAGAIVYRNPLTLTVLVEYKGVVHQVRKSASINVLRGDARAPYIESIKALDDLVEGDIKKFTVTVKDEVSPNGPTLSIRNNGWGSVANGAGYIFHQVSGSKDSSDPSIWKFDVQINLSETSEITKDYKDFTVGFTAHSAFGEASNTRSVSYRVLTNLLVPQFFNNKPQAFKKGVLNSYNFSFVDPKQEGTVEGEFVTNCSKGPVAGADCFCSTPTAGNLKPNFTSCTINWVPAETGKFEFVIKATNSINSSAVTAIKERTEKIVIEVTE